MARETLASLRARLAEAEAQRAALEAEAAALAARNEELAARARQAPTKTAKGRGRAARHTIAAVLVVLGLVLTPVAALVQHAQHELTNTDAFVAAYGPLAAHPAIQDDVVAAASTAISDAVDVPTIVDHLVTETLGNDLSPTAQAGIRALAPTLAEGFHAVVTQALRQLVSSEVFTSVWTELLRTSHGGLNAVLRGDSGTIVTLVGDRISVDLAPVVDFVEFDFFDRHIVLADLIPPGVDLVVPVVEVPGIGQIKLAYALLVAAGAWLPVAAALLLICGILVAPRRRAALMATSVALGVVIIVLAVALGIGRGVIGAVSSEAVSGASLGVAYDATVGALADTLLAIGAVAALGIVVAWVSGPSRSAAATRRRLGIPIAGLRERFGRADALGRFLDRRRRAVYGIVAAAAAATVVGWHPLTIWVVLVTVVVAAALLLLAESLRQPSASREQPVPHPLAQDLPEDVAR